MTQKTLLIGLDGASPNIIFPYARDGICENIGKLMMSGVYGNLRSTIPPVTCPAWVSSYTGVNPGKHGIFDFFLDVNIGKGKIKYANSRVRKSKTFWNILNASGKKVVIVNVPVTFPIEKIDGVMITGMLTPSLNSDFIYPEYIKEDIINLNYKIDIGDTMLERVSSYKKDKIGMLRQIENLIESRLKTCLFLMDHFDWDVFMVVFVALDRLQHFYWRYIDPKHAIYNSRESSKYLPLIQNVYKKIDCSIEKLVKKAGYFTNVVIYSDHGFKSLNSFFFPNNVLRKSNFLEIQKKGINKSILFNQSYIHKTIINFHLEKVLTRIPVHLRRSIGELLDPSREFTNIFNLISNKTKAYNFGSGFIYMNKNFFITEKEYNNVKEDIYQTFVDNFDSTSIVPYKKEQIYHGPQLNNIPDLILLSTKDISSNPLIPTNINTHIMGYSEKTQIPSLLVNGQHDINGIIICNGPNFPIKKDIKANIMDVTPTILKIYEEKIPSYIDGKSLI